MHAVRGKNFMAWKPAMVVAFQVACLKNLTHGGFQGMVTIDFGRYQ